MKLNNTRRKVSMNEKLKAQINKMKKLYEKWFTEKN